MLSKYRSHYHLCREITQQNPTLIFVRKAYVWIKLKFHVEKQYQRTNYYRYITKYLHLVWSELSFLCIYLICITLNTNNCSQTILSLCNSWWPPRFTICFFIIHVHFWYTLVNMIKKARQKWRWGPVCHGTYENGERRQF